MILKTLGQFVKNFDDCIVNDIKINRATKCRDGYDLGSRIHNIKSREQFIKNKPDRIEYLSRFGINQSK